MLSFLLRFIHPSLVRNRTRRLSHSAPQRRPRCRLAVEQLEERTVLSATATIAALGDSLTASYLGTPYGAAGDRNWVQQFQAEGNKHLAIDDVAVAGATSADLGGQVATVVGLVQAGSVQYATLIIGANDVSANLPAIFAGNLTPFVTEVVANIETALNTVAAAGHVRLAVGNIPDISITPAFQFFITSNPFLRQEVTQATTMANQQIEAFAAARGIPVIDLFGLGHLEERPLTVGGVQLNNLYAPDFFHPGSVAQGILGDTILKALGDASSPSLERFQLTQQQLLDNAPTPIPHRPGHTFFDVSPFVLFRGEQGHHRVDDDGSESVHSLAGAGRERLEALDQLFAAAGTGSLDESVFASRSR